MLLNYEDFKKNIQTITDTATSKEDELERKLNIVNMVIGDILKILPSLTISQQLGGYEPTHPTLVTRMPTCRECNTEATFKEADELRDVEIYACECGDLVEERPYIK